MNIIRPHRGPPYDLVLFDCDSTLTRIEGLDHLAAQFGLVDELAPITRAAMEGTLDFGSAYVNRMAQLQPDLDSINWLGSEYCRHVVTGAAELIARLQRMNKEVHMLSGGIRQALLPLAGMLGIPSERLHAVDIHFNQAGVYEDFDRTSPLTRQHGKAAVCRDLSRDGLRMVLIGDGVTDFEATAAGIDFIGFGGVVRRSATEARAAQYYAHADLSGLLPWLLTAGEIDEGTH